MNVRHHHHRQFIWKTNIEKQCVPWGGMVKMALTYSPNGVNALQSVYCPHGLEIVTDLTV